MIVCICCGHVQDSASYKHAVRSDTLLFALTFADT